MSKLQAFNPDSALGELADWEVQDGSNPTISRQRASALGADGDEIAAAQYGAQIAYSNTFVAKKTAGNLTLPDVGAIMSGKHVDSFEVSYSQTDFPRMNVSAHAHANIEGTSEEHDVCRTYKPTVTLPARAIGVPTALPGVFTCPEGVGMRSLTYSLSCNHIDEMDGDGEHLAGENHDGVETITLEFTGEVSADDLDIGEGWMLPDSEGVTRSNTAFPTSSITLTKHIAHTAAE